MTLGHFAVLALGYLLGSIPFGVLVARTQGVDIMKVGSGNTGATNVYRTLGKGAGLTVFALDVLKGVAPSWLGHYLFGDPAFGLLAGAVAVLGHGFSPWLGFRGGKGIATGLGALLGSSPLVAVCGFATFLAVLAATRYVSVASMVASLSLTPFALVFRQPVQIVAGVGALFVFVLVRHIPNLRRLAAGTESKFRFSGTSEPLGAERNPTHPPPHQEQEGGSP